MVRITTGQKESGCLDLNKAAELGNILAHDLIRKFCNEVFLALLAHIQRYISNKLTDTHLKMDFIKEKQMFKYNFVYLYSYKYINI